LKKIKPFIGISIQPKCNLSLISKSGIWYSLKPKYMPDCPSESRTISLVLAMNLLEDKQPFRKFEEILFLKKGDAARFR
jgi:hypothetical protein